MADVGGITVITNNVPRDIIDGWELTPKEREEFDYIDWAAIAEGEDSASFVRYKGELHDLNDLEGSPPDKMFPGWDAFRSDSFFSGILIKYVNDFEQVICGRYYC